MQVCGDTISKPYHNWLNKGTFLDMNKSEMVLDQKASSAQGVKVMEKGEEKMSQAQPL